MLFLSSCDEYSLYKTAIDYVLYIAVRRRPIVYSIASVCLSVCNQFFVSNRN